MAEIIQLRRDTAANWTSVNPILGQGEIGIELGNPAKFKIGDGIAAWNSLPFAIGSVNWADISGKPSTFPPSTHAYGSHTGLPDLSSLHSHSNKTALDNVSGINTGDQDLSGKVDKVTGKSLVFDTEIVKIHDHSNKTLLDSYTQTEINLADAVSKKHSNTLDHSHTNKTILDSIEQALTTVLKTNYDTAYTHSQQAHAPANAQKNSDILQSEIEAKLTGVISTHSHAGGGDGGLGYAINVHALTSSPADGATVYFGTLPKAPMTVAGNSKVYIRKAGTIKIAEIYCYSGTAGTAEAWSLYIRKNNTADTLIATLSVSASERVFSNAALNIAVAAGDYFEIKGVQPTWATNPATTIYGGYIYIE